MGILDAFRARHLFLALALSALVAGACAVVLLAGIPSTDDPRGAGGADETALPGQAPALRAVAARIADESRRAEPISPATGSAPRGSAHRPAPVGGVPMPPPPRGYSFVEHHGELAAAPIRLAVAAGPAADGPDWIGSPEAVALLVAQAAAASRDWSFGWIRLAEHARVDGLAAALRGTGAEIVGSAGRLVRARLPADPARLEAIAALPEVDGLGGVPSRTKLRMGRDDIAEIGSDATRPVFVTLMADDVDGRQRRALEARGAVVGSYDPVLRTYRANAGAQVLQALAAMDVVLAVEPVGLVAAAHDTAVPAMGADALRAYDGAGIFSGTGGASVPVGILDTGLNVGHHDIASHRDSICGANFVFRGGRDPQADLWYDHPGHGTHVAGTLLGNGIVERRFAGMAPSVRHIRVAKVLNEHSQGDADSVVRGMDYLAEGGCGEAADATGQAPLIVNASLRATGDSAGRGTPERKIDAMVWTNRQLYVVGQGNAGDGGHSAFAAAKNSLAVGAVLDSGELAAFSSRGPTADGRLAPNVVANGVGVRSAAGAGSVSGYERRHGSSMASASAAGAAALLMDALPVHRGRPALTRARLMASAIRPDAWLDDAAAFPLDNSNGPGTLQAGYGMGKASARSSILDRDGADGWTSGSAGVRLGDGEYASHEIVVPDGTHRLDLVLTWDEPPAEVVAPSVHSDLDLWLDSGDDCGGAACGEHSSLSRIDNVEWIIVRNPPPGTYAAKVVASRVYGAEPRAALAWTAIRGKSTPALAVAADRTVLEAAGRHDLTLTVTADAYLASGARLHVDCHDPTGGTGCDQVTFDSVAVAREDSVALTKELDIPCTGRDCAVDSISFGASIPLGEIAAGESQEVRLGVAVGGEASARLRFAASAWNAEAGSVTVGVGTDAGAQAGPAPPANDGFDAAAVIEGESGTRELNLHAAGTEPGEPDFGVPPAATLGNQAFPGRPAGSAWYRWTAPATGAFHFRVAAPDAPADDRADRVEAYVGDTIAGLERVGSGGWSASVFAEQGTTYRIRVGNLLRGVPTQLHWSRQPRPANDDFAAAAVLEGAAGRVDGTSVGATLEAGETLGEAAATTWYRWTAPDDGDWNFWVFNPPSVEGPLLRRVLVFEAESIASRRLVSKRPDATVGFRARRGTEYRIAVANDDASVPTGEYTLYWRLNTAPRTGDTFALAESIAGDASGMHFVQVDRDSRVEPGEPEETGIRTSWWVWEAPGDDVYTWRIVTPPGEERVLRVVALTGEGEPGLTDLEALAHADAFASPSFRLEATGGQRYWLAAGFPAQSHAGYTNARAEADLDWGPAPGNDDAAGARALAGASGSFAGSNRHATKASGAKSETLGDSTVWWTYEAPGAGWVRFAVAETGPWVLTVHRDGVDGGLEVLASSRWQAPGRLDGDADTSEVLFNAAPGVRYTISLGVRPGAAGTDFTLEWSGAEAPGWLRYAGRLVDGDRNAADVPVELRGPAGLAVHASGSPLYLASSIGLQVFERDAATGDLDFLQLLDGNLGRSSLHWDSHRDRLLAEDCGDWRVFAPAADDAQLEDRGELQVADEPGRCGAMLVMASDGAFVYRIGDGHVDLYSVDDAGSLGFVDAYEAPGVRSAVLDDRRDRVYAVAGDSLLVFDREGETGRLTRRDEAPALETARALALADDGDHLFVLDARGERTLVYALGEQAPRRLAEAPRFWLGADPDNECRFAALRGTDMIDAFCRSAAFRARWNPDDETVGGTDYIAHGLPDRYGNPLPDFDFPTAMVAAPDGRHVYLSTPHEGLLIFAGPDAADVDGDGDPDLAIQSQWAGDSGPFAGSRFTLGAVVRNRGDGASPATTIRAYRSDDAEISAADSEVGSVGFVGLDAGATRGQSIAVAAPATPGTYRYGLCVDAVEGESDTSNNCSAAVTIDVVAETRFPDLVVRLAGRKHRPAGTGCILHAERDRPEPGRSRRRRHHAALLPFDGRGHRHRRHRGRQRCGRRARRVGEPERVHRPRGAFGIRHVLLRGLRRCGCPGRRHRQQLLGRRRRHGRRAGSRRGVADGEQRRAGARRDLHAGGGSQQPGGAAIVGHAVALLPVRRRPDIHAGCRGRTPGLQSAPGRGDAHAIPRCAGAVGSGNVLLRRLRRRRIGGDGHRQQLFGGGDGHRRGGRGGLHGERAGRSRIERDHVRYRRTGGYERRYRRCAGRPDGRHRRRRRCRYVQDRAGQRNAAEDQGGRRRLGQRP